MCRILDESMNTLKLLGHGDVSKLMFTISTIKNQCQTKHLRLKMYRNEVWDLVDNLFYGFNK